MRRRWPLIMVVVAVLAVALPVSGVLFLRYVFPPGPAAPGITKDPPAIRDRIAARFHDAQPGHPTDRPSGAGGPMNRRHRWSRVG